MKSQSFPSVAADAEKKRTSAAETSYMRFAWITLALTLVVGPAARAISRTVPPSGGGSPISKGGGPSTGGGTTGGGGVAGPTFLTLRP